MMRFLDRLGFEQSLYYTGFFRHVVRPAFYRRLRNRETGTTDPEDVHSEALRFLSENQDILYQHRYAFHFPEIVVKIKGKRIQAFGTAAGFDKNCDALEPLSHVFGFQEPGTIVVDEREGNAHPRIFADEEREDVYNAQGFPSEGLEYSRLRLELYREHGGSAVIYASVCGIPPSADKLGAALREMETLLTKLNPYVNGFVWNPFSPNTDTLAALRRPEVFRDHAELIREIAGEKLALVKMGPYDEEKRNDWLKLLESWMGAGGDGLVAVNTYMVPKEQVPAENWGDKSAGRSGRFLKPYRMRAVADARDAFPNAIIFATGGISSPADAYVTLLAGADALEGYTPYTYHGLGLARELMDGVTRLLKRNGYNNLQEMREARRQERI